MTTTDQPAGEPDTEGSYGASVNFAADFSSLTANIATVIKGKSTVIHLMALALIADGHVLVEDVPGVGKTSLGKALARSVDGRFGRVQFTPDLLPTDVTGVSVWNRGSDTFEFRPGPVFSNVLLADEINRASPKTQSALLEAMAERQVTSDGVTHQLASPFMVIATQNPIEHEGTYALPEAQLDRFLMRLEIGYPDRAAELEILESHGDTREPADHLAPVLTSAQISAMSSSLERVYLAPALQSYLLDLADATRRHPRCHSACHPRCAGSATNRSGPRRSRGPRVRHARRCQKARPVRHPPPAARHTRESHASAADRHRYGDSRRRSRPPPRQGLTCRPAPAGGCWSPEPSSWCPAGYSVRSSSSSSGSQRSQRWS